MEMITNRIVLEVRNLKETLYFYEGVLGIKPSKHRPQLHVPGVWYDVEETRICFVLNRDKGQGVGEAQSSNIHFNLPFGDIEKVRKKLAFYCVSFEEVKSGGIVVHDPDGYKILIEPRE
ncbi:MULTISPECIES: VOC family protein [Bacillus cereus group]|uniref:Lactoylglutathione lyase n=1 Tax=Bacillus cereus TaxID=1396 RepID=A0AA44TDA8_BACCE|nr:MULTISPECIES: VOC family protein [Bacillus cereus group]EEL52008.1 hypothetical protein bcere0022_6770 [Bacillus cereus Rock3-44]PFA25670.1 lactoylglutathione lyase [Bacillus cereus]PFN08522.1 lactoylglutathione lyase [Bacillus cereus]PFO77760.1 lactoylglutathione lyase [Bacillus cereus]PFR97202.1 lactoylglutathione lyase [Bacillus cereus]